MFGQLCELLPAVPEPGCGACAGAVLPEPPVVPLGAVLLVVVVVVLVELAALAIAAPPPASAPVTTRVTSRGFSRTIVHLLFARVASRASTRAVGEP